MNLNELIASSDATDNLLKRIDEVATKYAVYEYGLPLHDDGARARLREVVYQWLIEQQDREST